MSDTKILQAILDGQTGLKKGIQEVRNDIKGVKEEGEIYPLTTSPPYYYF